MEMIERVARAMCLEEGRMGDALPIEMQRVDRDWRSHIPAARAAIEAMREPTGEMLDAIYNSESYYVGASSWRDAIDAALKESND